MARHSSSPPTPNCARSSSGCARRPGWPPTSSPSRPRPGSAGGGAACVLVGDDAGRRRSPSSVVPARRRVVLGRARPGSESSGSALSRCVPKQWWSSPAESARCSLPCWPMSTSGGHRAVCVVGVIGARGGVGRVDTGGELGLVARDRPDVRCSSTPIRGSGGMDMLLGCEAATGLRWPDVSAVNGRVRCSRATLGAARQPRAGCARRGRPSRGRRPAAGDVRAIVTAASARRRARRGGSAPASLDDAVVERLLGELDVVLLVSGLRCQVGGRERGWSSSCGRACS